MKWTPPKSWSAEEDATLKKLTAEGLSASMIAERIPGERSRNSIIGRQHRLGLMGKQTQRKKRASSLPVKPSASKYANRLNAATSAHVRALRSLEAKMRYAETSKTMQDTSGVEPLMVPLLELKSHHCRFPIGDVLDDGFAFCGHAKQDGSPYCSHHHARCYQASPTRRRVLPTPQRRAA